MCIIAYIDTGGYNVITMDWSLYSSSSWYVLPAIKAHKVGQSMAEFIDNLVEYKFVRSSDIHILGFSLGAHVVGECGKAFKHGQIGRITGKFKDVLFALFTCPSCMHQNMR